MPVSGKYLGSVDVSSSLVRKVWMLAGEVGRGYIFYEGCMSVVCYHSHSVAAASGSKVKISFK